MSNYKYKLRKGIDDLKSEYAFIGNSQGDTSVSNNIYDYLLSDGWMSYTFKCPMTNEDIAKEIELRKKWNKNYIQELKNNGTFGEEYENEIIITHHKIFDSFSNIVKHFENNLESYKFIMLDLNNKEK